MKLFVAKINFSYSYIAAVSTTIVNLKAMTYFKAISLRHSRPRQSPNYVI
jgi:hypothetical protein